jgi:hypothetical protein
VKGRNEKTFTYFYTPPPLYGSSVDKRGWDGLRGAGEKRREGAPWFFGKGLWPAG